MKTQPATQTPTLGESLDHYGEAYCMRAVNSHQELVKACKQAIQDHEFGQSNESFGLFEATVKKLKKALAKTQEVKP